MARTKRTGRASARAVVLGPNNYGKSKVRMVKVSRKGRVHTVRELSVDIALEGDFDAVHTDGDNSHCLPTDTMKNTVYALGKDHPIDTIESFAMHLGRHFLTNDRWAAAARVQVQEVAWDRVEVAGKGHPHCFTRGSDERQVCDVGVSGAGTTVDCGIESLVILKSTDSAFSGYMKDKLTTLPEARDRIMASSVCARWRVSAAGVKSGRFNEYRGAVRRAIVEAFAGHKSESVQHTLFEMGGAALEACPMVEEIRLSMPNKHCLLINLRPFGMENKNEIFVPTDEPHGLIEATVGRR